MDTLQHDIHVARQRLERCGQQHILAFVDTLDPSRQRSLLNEIAVLPLHELEPLLGSIRSGDGTATAATDSIAPLVPIAAHPTNEAQFKTSGQSLLSQGKVACFTVAGGQGTRLGWDAPKGTFPASPVTQKSLFQLFAEGILGLRRRFNARIDWIVMTSPQNDGATRDFFEAHQWWGLGASTVRTVVQGTMPAIGRDGRILLAGRGEIATNPDGHGGSIRALQMSGELSRLLKEGVEQLSYFQVDNPLVHPADPTFLGVHTSHPQSGGEMSSRSVERANAGEKVGVFCRRAGRVEVVEYSDMPPALSAAVDASGRLLHGAGNIAVHLISTRFIERLAKGEVAALPFHLAHKKVPCIDDHGNELVIDAPNGIKLETFIFDAVPLAHHPVVQDSLRGESFAPIKNADGQDSPATSMTAQTARAVSWLESAGVELPRRADGTVDARVEISPSTALCAEDLANAALPKAISRGATIVL